MVPCGTLHHGTSVLTEPWRHWQASFLLAQTNGMDNAAVACVFMNTVLMSTILICDDERESPLKRRRVDWDMKVELLLQEGQFKRYFRMSHASFEILLQKVAPHVHVDREMSRRRTGIEPITPVNRLQMFISWISGYSYHPARAVAGVGKATFYAVIWEMVRVITTISDSRLTLHFPSTDAEISSMTRAFETISSNNIITGCIGAIDGWLCPIEVPRRGDVRKVTSFFSGHYQR